MKSKVDNLGMIHRKILYLMLKFYPKYLDELGGRCFCAKKLRDLQKQWLRNKKIPLSGPKWKRFK